MHLATQPHLPPPQKMESVPDETCFSTVNRCDRRRPGPEQGAWPNPSPTEAWLEIRIKLFLTFFYFSIYNIFPRYAVNTRPFVNCIMISTKLSKIIFYTLQVNWKWVFHKFYSTYFQEFVNHKFCHLIYLLNHSIFCYHLFPKSILIVQ